MKRSQARVGSRRVDNAAKRSVPIKASISCASLLSLLGMASAYSAFAGDTTASATPMVTTKEMRAQMATIHEQMAACLRSDKSMSHCRTEMMTSCQKITGTQGCCMGQSTKGMHGGMMQSQPPTPDTKK
jgi:hypothetical protein